MAEPREPKGFIENREPGRVLEFFELDDKNATIQYAGPEDHEHIRKVSKARAQERLELPEVSGEIQDKWEKKWRGLKKTPRITKEKVVEIRERYQEKLLQYEREGSEFPESEEDRNALLGSFTDPHKPFFLVATVEGEIVGYIEMGDRPGRDPEAIWVHTVSILPEYQGKIIDSSEGQEKTSFAHKLLAQGIGEARNEEALKDRKKIAAATHTWTPRAISFWEKENFDREDFLEGEESDSPEDPYRIKMVRHFEELE